MSDLSSERSSIRTLPEQEVLDLIVSIRAKRREAIISTARRKTAPKKSKQDSTEKLLSKLSAAQKAELLATLMFED
jgi:hypothetical protein